MTYTHIAVVKESKLGKHHTSFPVLLPSHVSSAAGVFAGSTGLSAAASIAGAFPAGGAPPIPTWLLLELHKQDISEAS